MLAKFIFRYEVGDAYLGAVSRFMSNVFEFGDALLPQDGPENPEDIGPNQPYLNLATRVYFISSRVFLLTGL
jgi:hypothetical protein